MNRRKFLAAMATAPLAAIALSALTSRTAAAQPSTRLKSILRDPRGTTLWLSLDHAPFANVGYHDDTVIVFVPSHYRYASDEGVAALVHFHGHNGTAERAMETHQLREQLSDSKQNAILVIPQLAVMAADSSCGHIEEQGGLMNLLSEVITRTAHEAHSTLGNTAFPYNASLGTVCVSAHSGGYHAAACCLRAGGVDVRETYLFDALYSETETFRDWVLARHGESPYRRHKLVSYFTPGGTTEANDSMLRAQLEKAGVLCMEERQEGEMSRHELSHTDAVFVHSGLFHNQVTWETNALRDALFASVLPRHVASNWFARKNGSRPIERRR
jgi:hypothetical protein